MTRREGAQTPSLGRATHRHSPERESPWIFIPQNCRKVWGVCCWVSREGAQVGRVCSVLGEPTRAARDSLKTGQHGGRGWTRRMSRLPTFWWTGLLEDIKPWSSVLIKASPRLDHSLGNRYFNASINLVVTHPSHHNVYKPGHVTLSWPKFHGTQSSRVGTGIWGASGVCADWPHHQEAFRPSCFPSFSPSISRDQFYSKQKSELLLFSKKRNNRKVNWPVRTSQRAAEEAASSPLGDDGAAGPPP